MMPKNNNAYTQLHPPSPPPVDDDNSDNTKYVHPSQTENIGPLDGSDVHADLSSVQITDEEENNLGGRASSAVSIGRHRFEFRVTNTKSRSWTLLWLDSALIW
jgi:hypothetical protein